MTYKRVIPRDLFNEANLLKCYGALWIALDNARGHTAKLGEHNPTDPSDDYCGDPFNIEMDESTGSISVANIPFTIGGLAYKLSRPLNSRDPYPLYCVDEFDMHEWSVFNDDGTLSAEFLDLIKDRAPERYRRGRSDYAAIRELANNPEQVASQVSEDEYNEMLGCVPPIHVKGVPGFLVGEALTGDHRGTVYANYFVSRDGVYCARYHCVED